MKNSLSEFQISEKTVRNISYATLFSLIAFCLFYTAYPYLPAEGDPFGCWFEYARNLRQSGLGEALLHADAAGRYPGYPLMLALTEGVFRLDFLESMLFLRLFFSFLSIVLLFALIRRLTGGWVRSTVYTAFIILTPALLSTISMNTQDILKLPFYFLSIYFAVQLLKTTQPFDRKTYFSFSLACIGLGSVRAPEIFPLFAFLGVFITFSDGDLRSKSKRFVTLIAPGFIYLFLLHAYGKSVVGHWSLSQPAASGGADIWTKFAIKHLSTIEASFASKVLLFVKLSIENVLNKTAYFFEDYILKPGSLSSILDAHQFYPGLQRVNDFKIYLTYPFAVLTIGFFAFLLFRKQTKILTRSLIAAAFTSAGFYIFGLLHYEPRYWLIVYSSLTLALITEFTKRWLVLAAALTLPFLLIYNFKVYRDREVMSQRTWSESQRWMQDLSVACKTGAKTVIIPYEFYTWSAYRFLASQTCPEIRVWRADPPAPPESIPEENGVKVFTSEYFKNN